MELVDTHTHLYDAAFDGDRDETVARAVAGGVGRMLLPAIDSRTDDAMFGLRARYPDNFFPMAGLHPTSVNEIPDYRAGLDWVERLLRDRPFGPVYGVGEVGLDFYWSRGREAEQKEAFAFQIDLALGYGMPLAVHTREAWPEMLDILSAYRGRGLRGVMHAFSGSAEEYRAVKALGDFAFGIGGMVTFRNSALRGTVLFMSPEDMVLETDSPYLTPAPYRGRRNESSYLGIICAHAAQLLGMDAADLARRTTENAERMFGLPRSAAE